MSHRSRPLARLALTCAVYLTLFGCAAGYVAPPSVEDPPKTKAPPTSSTQTQGAQKDCTDKDKSDCQ